MSALSAIEPLAWFKSSHSGAEGGRCVEVAFGTVVHVRDSKAAAAAVLTAHPSWFKSSHSGAEGGDCVEVTAGAVVRVRDSKVVAGPVVAVSRGAWAGFLGLASSQPRG
ncbi:DUF397 domain-containing protein [Streptomyces tagetis]|uniref:DUF397 domain-containing protein n=1 Tax=Streptomyces tagetis TaxID=2820809 RepID=A0A941AYG2_9ACTN|nr:DUF397 domain-containing protein [Streptomyces sp. RG38]MBQ0824995.1 DUF397 domain-containing protein [Streptomyces sp. RG38]